MKYIILFVAAFALSGCVEMKHHWDRLEPAEKVAVSIVGAATVAAIVVRNGQHSQCYAHHSVNTDCVTGHK